MSGFSPWSDGAFAARVATVALGAGQCFVVRDGCTDEPATATIADRHGAIGQKPVKRLSVQSRAVTAE